MKLDIDIGNIEDCTMFCKKIITFTSDIDIYNKKKPNVIFDAKSLLAVFAMDRDSLVTINIHSNDNTELNKFKETMKLFQR